MSRPARVLRCPYCRGPAYKREETWQQYRVLCYGCSRCELEIPAGDIGAAGITDEEREARLARFRRATGQA